MLRAFFSGLEFPWLAGLSIVFALVAVPSLVRFFYGATRQEVTRELGVGDPLQTQISVVALLLYGRWWSLRAVAFVATFLVVAGVVSLVLAGLARAIQ